MPEQPGIEEIDGDPPKASTVLLILGSALFLASFFLPAVRVSGTDLEGWVCAQVTLFSISEPAEMDLLAFGSGLLNVFILLYLGARLTGSARGARRLALYAVAVCLALTWIFFRNEKIQPLIGHYLWAAGALLITGWEGIQATKALFLRG
ncbi:MAG: hypothetical protein QM757_13575 [Paludibaculum sp.]